MSNVENYTDSLKPAAHPGPPPNITILTEAAGQRAMAAYEARLDAHVAWVMSRPACSWSAEEKQTVLSQILRSGRERGLVKMNAQQTQGGTDLVPTTLIDQDPVTGHFLPGNRLGFKRAGSANKLTKAMRLAAIEEMAAAGDQGNPLLILYRIGANPDTPLKLRADVAFKLATLLWGVKSTFEIEAPDPADEERIARTRRIFTTMFAEEFTNEQPR